MSDLENQVENTEEVSSIVEEPTKGAEKGDKSAHKQGSSSEEKIESGKAEVVKPEENPVDKAVAAAKKASGETKPVSDDVNKGAEKGDSKAEKIKEDEDSNAEDTIVEKGASKMELIKAAVDSMKGLTKEELNKLFSSLSEDEVDESLTKAEVARNIVEALKQLSLEEVQKLVKEMGYEDEEEDEDDDDDDDNDDDDDDDQEESVKESAAVESSLVEIEIDDDLSKISESLDLSEENAEKARTIFKAAINSKVEEAKAELEEHYQTELKSQVETVKEELTSSVDKYLTYCAEEWTKENELAIERGLRSEMTENFIQGLKTLFVEHYVEVPEDKYDVMDELANRLDEMEAKLDAEVSKNMDITEELGSLKRQNVVTKACEDLSESQTEKMVSLSNGVDFTDEADFEEKVAEIKEAYFGVDSESIAEETISEEGNGDFEVEKAEKVLDPSIARYSEALTKLKPLG